MQGDHVEVALHHHGPVVLADGRAGLVEAEQVLTLLKHLRFRGVEVFGFTAIEAAATEANDPALAIGDGHHHPMAKAVVEAITALAGHHQTRGLQQLWGQALHLLQVAQQAIPALGRVAEPEGLERGFAQATAIAQIGQSGSPLRGAQLGTEPASSQAQGPMQLLTARELLAQPLLLGALEGFNRQLVLARQLQHHIAEAVALQLHQELDGVAAGPAGEAVIELLGRRHRHRR